MVYLTLKQTALGRQGHPFSGLCTPLLLPWAPDLSPQLLPLPIRWDPLFSHTPRQPVPGGNLETQTKMLEAWWHHSQSCMGTVGKMLRWWFGKFIFHTRNLQDPSKRAYYSNLRSLWFPPFLKEGSSEREVIWGREPAWLCPGTATGNMLASQTLQALPFCGLRVLPSLNFLP